MDNQINVTDKLKAEKIARAIKLLTAHLNACPDKLVQLKTAFPHYEDTESLISDILHDLTKLSKADNLYPSRELHLIQKK